MEKLATRYRGRIESYELWDYPSHPLMYAGSLETLGEMVERASRIIRRIDPNARLACPSFGSLWTGKGRALLREFARTGAYAHCDAAALKMPPRKGDGRPEEIIELSRSMRNLLHEENVHDIELWNTGPEWDIDSTPPLDARQAGDYAVRFYLSGLYGRHYGVRRMYFYNWGSTHVPIIVQPVGGPRQSPESASDDWQRGWTAPGSPPAGGARAWTCRRACTPAASSGTVGTAHRSPCAGPFTGGPKCHWTRARTACVTWTAARYAPAPATGSASARNRC